MESDAEASDSRHGAPVAWVTRHTEVVADCRVFSVLRKKSFHPVRGQEAEFAVIQSRDWVNVVAETREGDLVMVRQFRHGVESLSLEVPGGVMEAGEDPIEAARRELREETGFVGGDASMLGVVHPNPAIQSNRCHLVMIRGVERGAALEWDEHEEIEIELIKPDEVLRLARTGGVTHALALNAVCLYALECGSGSSVV